MRDLWFNFIETDNNPLWFNAEGRKTIKVKGTTGQTTDFPEMEEKGEDPRYPTGPIGSFQLCCLWGCDDCEWTWGGGGRWIHKATGRIHRR